MADSATTVAGAAAPAGPRRGLSLALRFFLVTALLVAAAVGAAVVVTLVVGGQIADEAVGRALDRSSSLQGSLRDSRLDGLWLSTQGLASDPSFSSYVVASLEGGDILSAADQISERQRELGLDLAMIVDPSGTVLVDTLDPARQGTDLSADPLIARALEEFGAAGTIARDGRLYEAAAVPIDTAGVVAGLLVFADALDEVTALDMRRASDTEIAFLGADGRLLATTLDGRAAEDLGRQIAAWPAPQDGSATAVRELELDGRGWAAHVRPVVDVDEEPIGRIVNLASIAEARGPFRRITTVLLVVGLLAVLAALVLSYFSARQVVAPVRELAEAAQAAAEGDYEREIPAATAAGELGALAGAFGKLLSELREKRDMEAYISELTRTLPVQEEGAVTALSPPERRQVTLLAAELRVGDDRPAAGEAQETLSRLSRDLGVVTAAIGRHGGTVEVVLGHRVVASFDGRPQSERALAAADEILAAEGERAAFVLVMTAGTLVTGTVSWSFEPRHAVAGEAVDDLEALLRVGRPRTLLLSDRAHEAIRPLLAAAGIEARQHKSSVSTRPLYSLDRAAVGRVDLPEVAATQAMTAATAPMAEATLSGVGPGSVLGGRFEILSVLGAGGMGVVYKARDRTLGELVAVKMLKEEMVQGEHLEQLKDELRVARRITHPNVLRTYDFGEMSGLPFISMEYVRGITLRQLLDQSGRLPLSAGLRIARQLSRGLEAAHEQGILHRDIKPENLIIEQNGNAKLMDFGIAQRIQRVLRETEANALVGTPYYLAPEQIQGKEPDVRADLYACGMVLYEVFTGALPFDRRGPMMQIIQAKLQERPTPPSRHWEQIPPTLERIILRCLERDRGDRYPDIATLLRELETLRG